MHDCDRTGQAVPGPDPRKQSVDPLTVKRRLSCVPYAYRVAAHFDANRGTGRRLELRACDLRFAKQ